MTPDMINGLFELCGAMFLTLNVRQLWRDRNLSGVHWSPTVFFTAWGFWNLIYYPGLGQWWSFVGGCAIAAANCAWLGVLIWISRGRR